MNIVKYVIEYCESEFSKGKYSSPEMDMMRLLSNLNCTNFDLKDTTDLEFLEMINGSEKLASVIRKLMTSNINYRIYSNPFYVGLATAVYGNLGLSESDEDLVEYLKAQEEDISEEELEKQAYEKIKKYVENAKEIDYAKIYIMQANAKKIYSFEKEQEMFEKYTNATGEEKEQLKSEIAEHNLKLVIHYAKKYMTQGTQLLDLIQEGNMGLVTAIEKFDYTKGFKFSTYASWWIRQFISRSVANSKNIIRIPVHMGEKINKYNMIERNLISELGRTPSDEEMMARTGFNEKTIEEIKLYRMEVYSIDMPLISEDEGNLSLSDLIVDPMYGEKYSMYGIVKDTVHSELENSGLTDREEEVIRLRYGLDDGVEKTLEEIGKKYGVSRQRIEQIEKKALRKLKNNQELKNINPGDLSFDRGIALVKKQ